ncbi:hypothetical protein PC39_13182 [Salinisphaera sp. PC39]
MCGDSICHVPLTDSYDTPRLTFTKIEDDVDALDATQVLIEIEIKEIAPMFVVAARSPFQFQHYSSFHNAIEQRLDGIP